VQCANPDVITSLRRRENLLNGHGCAAVTIAGQQDQSLEREWLDLQRRFSKNSLRGTWRVVPGSDHLIGNSWSPLYGQKHVQVVSDSLIQAIELSALLFNATLPLDLDEQYPHVYQHYRWQSA
jgi:hypothetical protein